YADMIGLFFFFQAEDGIRDFHVTGVQTCALPISGSSVLELADGSWLYLPEGAQEPVVVPAGHPEALAQVEESRAWLSSGTVPGRTPAERELAERALLDLRLLLQDDGAVAAAWHTIWKYS